MGPNFGETLSTMSFSKLTCVPLVVGWVGEENRSTIGCCWEGWCCGEMRKGFVLLVGLWTLACKIKPKEARILMSPDIRLDYFNM